MLSMKSRGKISTSISFFFFCIFVEVFVTAFTIDCERESAPTLADITSDIVATNLLAAVGASFAFVDVVASLHVLVDFVAFFTFATITSIGVDTFLLAYFLIYQTFVDICAGVR